MLGDKDVGIIGPRIVPDDATSDGCHEEGAFDFEVRAFCPLDNPFEDPATGSLNAGLAQWLLGHEQGSQFRTGYRVRQGTCVNRTGDIVITADCAMETMDDREGQ
eukprot:CAMPEP_0114446606 /NCGR_PEP_ID=MMETSP0103-20121206/19306_1 /TAXON_ID=37642 ORGANISM="Paraphysomonas imperforata, Strain PA2" /NCGR_SAMPLE_ID=MMETSP0103 /ASSEMBLY_ACC=CAM_ASM_000201 /LENGTH=104 /DNA_ID=CAMNT_0001618415 /DNA_START=33 /DNA_END=344 /DNA_ORIENTATION=+